GPFYAVPFMQDLAAIPSVKNSLDAATAYKFKVGKREIPYNAQAALGANFASRMTVALGRFSGGSMVPALDQVASAVSLLGAGATANAGESAGQFKAQDYLSASPEGYRAT